MEQWEIRWAKPIGPIKQAERQRCINEAISQSKFQKEVKTKKFTRKPHSKFLQNQHENKQEPLDLQNVTLLSNFVTNVFQAMCSFECLTSYDPFGYIHKVCNII